MFCSVIIPYKSQTMVSPANLVWGFNRMSVARQIGVVNVPEPHSTTHNKLDVSMFAIRFDVWLRRFYGD